MYKAHIVISIAKQTLSLIENSKIIKTYPISSAKNGASCVDGSGCTPLGLHKIKLKIGMNCPLNSVFVARRATGQIYSKKLAKANPDKDWILSRIIWLTGLEPGVNKGQGVDSLRRFIYIHGTPDTKVMGTPDSKGCIRMQNDDMVNLFDRVHNNMLVKINHE